jgi:hypothetical protein
MLRPHHEVLLLPLAAVIAAANQPATYYDA